MPGDSLHKKRQISDDIIGSVRSIVLVTLLDSLKDQASKEYNQSKSRLKITHNVFSGAGDTETI
ncbi:hypothetical protein C0J52_17398 [Blattella germanica]|nr:hypothetical protein C0J52_17398 [Blattella germanica]